MKQIIRKVKNRYFIFLKPKQPFVNWVKKHTHEDYTLAMILEEKSLFAVPRFINRINFEEELIGEFFRNIFCETLERFEVFYEDEEIEGLTLKDFKRYFSYDFIEDCLDLFDHRPFQRRIRTERYR